jgi:hypothetical protein
MSSDPLEISCSICNKPVDLQTAKIDDKGKAVHAECYFLTVVKQLPSQPITRPPAS